MLLLLTHPTHGTAIYSLTHTQREREQRRKRSERLRKRNKTPKRKAQEESVQERAADRECE